MNRTRNGILKAINETGDITEIYPKTKIENVDGLVNDLEGKVDKISDKGLSSEDYTTAVVSNEQPAQNNCLWIQPTD